MNISELARKLNISTKELKEMLPAVGFDIGEKAIKIDDGTARKIIGDWRNILRSWRELKRKEREDKVKVQNPIEEVEVEKEVKIPPIITVRDFSNRLNLSVTKVIEELIKNGIMASLNERIDFDTATIVAEDLGYKVLEDTEIEDLLEDNEEKMKEIIKKEGEDSLTFRPPVVVVMGHVDHGKTQLLDTIRKTNIIAGESGGITQHIGAYQVEKKGKKITFVDTPGHEAFTAMRSRGAKIADIAILIVAADDGVKPQTVEAMKIIQQAKLPMIVAINKIDKSGANLEKVKQELSSHNLVPEEWGGKTICVPISAKEATGIDELLDMILLVCDMEKDNIVANPDSLAGGTIIESHIDKGEGAVATALVQNGTLKVNDCLSINGGLYGKVRAMKNFRNELLDEAGPSMPVKILGFKIAPQVGDIMEVPEDVKCLNKKIKCFSSGRQQEELVCTPVEEDDEEDKKQKLNIILKVDVLGSLEAITESLEKIEHDELEISIVSKGLGNITESDILSAEATGAKILGFSVSIAPTAENLARDKEVDIKIFKIIYELIDDVKDNLEKLLKAEIVKIDLGKMKVIEIFRTESKSMIIGGVVTEGNLEKDAKIKIVRDGQEVGNGLLSHLQKGKEEVKSVKAGHEAGIKFEGKTKDYQGRPIIQIDDILEVYKEETKLRSL